MCGRGSTVVSPVNMDVDQRILFTHLQNHVPGENISKHSFNENLTI